MKVPSESKNSQLAPSYGLFRAPGPFLAKQAFLPYGQKGVCKEPKWDLEVAKSIQDRFFVIKLCYVYLESGLGLGKLSVEFEIQLV